jgi:hypothetical protein
MERAEEIYTAPPFLVQRCKLLLLADDRTHDAFDPQYRIFRFTIKFKKSDTSEVFVRVGRGGAIGLSGDEEKGSALRVPKSSTDTVKSENSTKEVSSWQEFLVSTIAENGRSGANKPGALLASAPKQYEESCFHFCNFSSTYR